MPPCTGPAGHKLLLHQTLPLQPGSAHSYSLYDLACPAPAEHEWLLSQTQPPSLQRNSQAPGLAVAPNEAFASTVQAARERTPIAVGVGKRCDADQGQRQRQHGAGDGIGLDAGGLMCSFFPWQGTDAAAGRAGEHDRGLVHGWAFAGRCAAACPGRTQMLLLWAGWVKGAGVQLLALTGHRCCCSWQGG